MQTIGTICNDEFGNELIMVVEDGCLVFKRNNDIIAKWCGYNDLFYVLQGYEIINTILKPQQVLEVYNNDGIIECEDTDPNTLAKGDVTGRKPDELLDKLYAKGVAFTVHYPVINSGGAEVNDADNNCELTVSNFKIDIINPEAVYESDEIILPLYTYYSLLNNPTCQDITKMTNYLRIKNLTANDIIISGVVLFAGSGGEGCQAC